MCFGNSTTVIVDREHLKDLMHAPENILSFGSATRELVQTDYIAYPGLAFDMFHRPVTQKQLTQHIPKLIEDIVEELDNAFLEHLPPTDGKSALVRANSRLDSISCLPKLYTHCC